MEDSPFRYSLAPEYQSTSLASLQNACHRKDYPFPKRRYKHSNHLDLQDHIPIEQTLHQYRVADTQLLCLGIAGLFTSAVNLYPLNFQTLASFPRSIDEKRTTYTNDSSFPSIPLCFLPFLQKTVQYKSYPNLRE